MIGKTGFILMACGAALLCGPAGARAAYPDHPIQLIVSMPPGGGADTVARVVAAKFGDEIGQTVVIENRAGAAGRITANFVAHAKPDGYTLAWVTNSQTSPSDTPLGYDQVASFTPITLVSETNDILVALPSFAPNNMKDLIALAKAKPGTINVSTVGAGTPSDLETRLLMKDTGASFVMVPYQGGGEALNAVMGGFVQLYFATSSTALAQLKSGKLKALGVSTTTRSAILPDIATVSEQLGLPDFDAGDWLGVLAPAGIPAAVATKLNTAWVAAATSPEVKAKLTGLGWTVVADTPTQFKAVMAHDIATWNAVDKAIAAK